MTVFKPGTQSCPCPNMKHKFASINTQDDRPNCYEQWYSTIKTDHRVPLEGARCTRQTQCASRSSIKYILITVLALFLVVNAVAVACVLTDSPSSRTTDLTAVQKDQLCTICTSTGLHPGTVDTGDGSGLTLHRLTDSTSLCCRKYPPGVLTLLALFEDRVADLSSDNSSLHGAHTANGAHLYVDAESLKPPDLVLRWSDDYGYGSAYTSHNVTSDGRRLHVKRAGIYHVYSFLTFKTRQDRKLADNLLHIVNRNNQHLQALGDQVLLMAKMTLPVSSGTFVTSYLSATVRLRKYDNIFVDVSNLWYIYKFSPSNYFGLYYIGE